MVVMVEDVRYDGEIDVYISEHERSFIWVGAPGRGLARRSKIKGEFHLCRGLLKGA